MIAQQFFAMAGADVAKATAKSKQHNGDYNPAADTYADTPIRTYNIFVSMKFGDTVKALVSQHPKFNWTKGDEILYQAVNYLIVSVIQLDAKSFTLILEEIT